MSVTSDNTAGEHDPDDASEESTLGDFPHRVAARRKRHRERKALVDRIFARSAASPWARRAGAELEALR